MMEQFITFRTLRADEIDCRVQKVTANGVSVLLYKDARCDMNILDETVGAMNWTRQHSRDNANCTVSIYDDGKKAWVSKEDTGTESNTEAEKGLASDSFKRACVNWGIGRELYTAPFIWVNAGDIEWTEKKQPKTKFRVAEIGYDDQRRIDRLTIVTDKGKTVYAMGAKPKPKPEQKPEPTAPANDIVTCPICGGIVLRAKSNKTGKLVEPMEILRKLGGMCPECYKRMNNESKNQRPDA